MAKKKIKTSRYWTRKCENCGFEYPNWFTNCPRCHADWHGETKRDNTINQTNLGGSNSQQSEATTINQAPTSADLNQKTVRIIAQIAEEGFVIKEITIFFSADGGVSWFSMPMFKENDYFVAEIQNVPLHSIIVYYLKIIDAEGNEFIENNDGEYYYYEVEDFTISDNENIPSESGSIASEVSDNTRLRNTPQLGADWTPSQSATHAEAPSSFKNTENTPPPLVFDQDNSVDNTHTEKQESVIKKNGIIFKPIETPPIIEEDDAEAGDTDNSTIDEYITDSNSTENLEDETPEVIFTPLPKAKTEDGNLKICPNCKSKIKKDWTICPICGAPQP
ncbi:MAG: zinc ribbon domain-containing protein [Promethearchaeota archaeon]